jgi:hypothetical protein
MSDRVTRLFQRFDADVHDRMAVVPADREEVLLLMHGLCQRAALLGFAGGTGPSGVGGERLAPLAASEMVDLILTMRDEAAAKVRKAS